MLVEKAWLITPETKIEETQLENFGLPWIGFGPRTYIVRKNRMNEEILNLLSEGEK